MRILLPALVVATLLLTGCSDQESGSGSGSAAQGRGGATPPDDREATARPPTEANAPVGKGLCGLITHGELDAIFGGPAEAQLGDEINCTFLPVFGASTTIRQDIKVYFEPGKYGTATIAEMKDRLRGNGKTLGFRIAYSHDLRVAGLPAWEYQLEPAGSGHDYAGNPAYPSGGAYVQLPGNRLLTPSNSTSRTTAQAKVERETMLKIMAAMARRAVNYHPRT